jgi:hypothetical protein
MRTKMIRISRSGQDVAGAPTRTLVALAFLAGLLALAVGCRLSRPASPAASPAPDAVVTTVTADDVARAMQEDRFFAQYGQTPLRIDGTVLAVTKDGNGRGVELNTSVSTKVWCDTASMTPAIEVGSTLTVLSMNPRSDASRDGPAIRIANCIVSGGTG